MTDNMRSHLCPSFGICADVRQGNIDWDLYRRLVDQWRRVAGCMLGDFYPLTPYSLDADCWIAWQFDRPETGEGMIQAFRRAQNPGATLVVHLAGLDPAATYTVRNLDDDLTTVRSGRDLRDQGLVVAISQQPGSALIHYQRKSR